MDRPNVFNLPVFLSLVAILIPLNLNAQAGQRAALVIGNGAYASSPLSNPPNDAADMAALFRAADMEVLARTNLDLAGMEQAVTDFIKLLKGKDSAVVYYAGHGMQVNGENYLIPIKEDIRTDAQVRSRSLSVSDLLDRIKDSGVGTAVLFLDACRDNPFPGSSRSGSRGLTVVAVPRDVETLVAYATEPGSTAADGTARNGVFTAALLKNLAEPGLNIAEAMIKVRADVLALSGGKQSPRVDLGLSRPWYLVDPETAARKAREASGRANAELAALERELADRQTRIGAAKDAAAREALELEQRKQEALRAAKKLEADSLERTAGFRRQAAEAEGLKQAQVQASIRAQEALSAAMAKRRAELELLGSQAGGDDPDGLVASVERLRTAVAEIRGQFDLSRQEAERGIRAGFEPLFAVFAKAEPELWETDAEFAQRVRTDKTKLEADRSATLANRKTALDSEETRQTAGLQSQLDKAIAVLEGKTWSLPASQVRVEPGTYDRNTRLWPIQITSLDPLIEAEETIIIDFSKSADLRTELTAFDRAVKANALAGEIGWGIRGDPPNKRYFLVLRSLAVRNLETGKAVATASPRKDLAHFTAGNRSAALSLTKADVDFSVPSGELPATVYVNGQALGTTPLATRFQAGQAEVRYLWSDGTEWKEIQTWTGGARYTLDPSMPRVFVDFSVPTGELPAMVYVDGRALGTTPFATRFKVGQFEVRFLWPDGTEWKETQTWTVDAKYTLRPVVYRLPKGEIHIKGGSFQMGSDSGESDEKPMHTVRVSDFYMMKTEVTQKDYTALMGTNPSNFKGDTLPVEQVSWYEAVAYANKLSQKDGLRPVYIINGTKVNWDRKANGWRLPTEAEWEYAARGGVSNQGYAYASSNDAGTVAWYDGNSGNKTNPVGTKAPNVLGLYDLSGNVWEWCWDWYTTYSNGIKTDPAGAASGSYRIFRSGSWFSVISYLHSTYRNFNTPDSRYYDIGFRLVRGN